jgi:hypothetical protein
VKQFLAYIFLFVFSFQVLPVKELGKLLFKGQMTEEVHESGCMDDSGCAKIKKGSEPCRLADYSFSVNESVYIDTKVNIAIHISELLPAGFVPDILTPPPNC